MTYEDRMDNYFKTLDDVLANCRKSFTEEELKQYLLFSRFMKQYDDEKRISSELFRSMMKEDN